MPQGFTIFLVLKMKQRVTCKHGSLTLAQFLKVLIYHFLASYTLHPSLVHIFLKKCNNPVHSLECKTYIQNIGNNECVCNICIVSNAKWKWVGSEGSWRGGIIHKSAVPPPIRINSTHYTITVHSTKVANGGGVVELEYYRCVVHWCGDGWTSGWKLTFTAIESILIAVVRSYVLTRDTMQLPATNR